MSTSRPDQRVYRDLNTRERQGWVMGLTVAQAMWCVGAGAPVLASMSVGRYRAAFGWALVAAAVVVLVVVPVRGRPAFRWLADLTMFQWGVLMRWSRWQSMAALGLVDDPDVADLPGVLARLEFPDGPPYRGAGRVCLIHDTAEGRWGATARLTHSGTGMLSDEECERLADRLGSMLIGLSHRETINRVSLLVRTVPDDGAEYATWRAGHEVADAPWLARQATDEIDHTVAAVSVRTELFVTVSGTESALRRQARDAGGGVAGRASVLYRTLDGIEDGLHSIGARAVTWLGATGVAEAIRTGFNPATAAALAHQHLARVQGESGQGGGLPLSQAGPTIAPTPAARAYHHDGFSSVAWAVQPSEAGTVFGALGPLLAVRTAGERRTLAVHYEVLTAADASRQVRSSRFAQNVIADTKAHRGFSATALEQRRRGGALAQESAVAAGHALVRWTIASSITVPRHWNLEDHAAQLENDASGRFRLLRLDLAQPSAFVAAAIPVGIGLPRLSQSGVG